MKRLRELYEKATTDYGADHPGVRDGELSTYCHTTSVCSLSLQRHMARLYQV